VAVEARDPGTRGLLGGVVRIIAHTSHVHHLGCLPRPDCTSLGRLERTNQRPARASARSGG